MFYARAEKVHMVFIYGEYCQNMRAAMRVYAERYPDFTTPSRSTFANIIQTFKEQETSIIKTVNGSNQQPTSDMQLTS